MMFKELLAMSLVGATAAISLSSLNEMSGRQASNTSMQRPAEGVADFQKRVQAYVALQKKVAAQLPGLQYRATPEDIEARRTAMFKLMTAARAGARKGDVFGPAMADDLRTRLGNVIRGPNGAQMLNAIYDEPHAVVLVVNSWYPDDVPLSTMPTEILKVLPELPKSLEFRFVGRHLILMDVPAQLIVDVVENALPEK